MFLHAFSVFNRDLSVIYTPNGKTAELGYYRRVAKAKERICKLGKITGTREPPYLEVGESQRLKLCKFEIQIQYNYLARKSF